MRYQLQFRPYHRRFQTPVRFGSNLAESRSGLVIRLEGENGHLGFGEVAPIESFGSESAQRSQALLRSFHGMLRGETIHELNPQDFPCTCYALKQAMRSRDTLPSADDRDSEGILTAKLFQNASGSNPDPDSPAQGNIYKVKIAHRDKTPDQERAQVVQLATQCIENDAKLRLDANEGLDKNSFMDWAVALEPYQDVIEFIEQPLDRWDLEGMAALAEQSPIPIALDESLSLLRGQWNWSTAPSRWLYVVKPSLGDEFWIPAHLKDRVIWSSVFETAIGFQSLLELPRTPWIPGFDTQRAFIPDGLEYPYVETGYLRSQVIPAKLWEILE